MANNIYPNPNYNFPQIRNGDGVAAYLLGVGPMPPPHPQNIAVGMGNHLLDRQAAGLDDNVDENIDPQQGPQPGPTHNVAARQIVVRLPVNDKVTGDIDFSIDIPYRDFRDRIVASMSLDPATAALGWMTSDQGKRAAAHELNNHFDMENAFNTILNIQDNPHRRKEIFLEIVHLNPVAPVPAPKKTGGNRITDFAYGAELRIVKEKLRCKQHDGPNRWCYVSPEHPTEHVLLGYEEISLWARKIHDNDADADCVVPPNCLFLDNLRHKASRVRQVNSKSNVPPIHIHINNPLGETSCHNILGDPHPAHGMKRPWARSITSENSTDSDEEPLPLADVLEILNEKYPQINLPQYMSILEKEKIVYAETVLEFDKDYLVGLGIPEGAVRPLLKGVEKVIGRRKKEKKRIRVSQRQESIEV